MTTVKIEGSIGGAAAEALAPHARTIYNKPGGSWRALVEVEHVERVQPAPGSDKDPVVRLRITALELPTAGRQSEIVGEVMQALYVQRTANGTLDEAGAVQLHSTTLDLAAATLSAEEAARLRVYLNRIERDLNAMIYKPELTVPGAIAAARKIQRITVAALGRDIEDEQAGLAKAGA